MKKIIAIVVFAVLILTGILRFEFRNDDGQMVFRILFSIGSEYEDSDFGEPRPTEDI